MFKSVTIVPFAGASSSEALHGADLADRLEEQLIHDPTGGQTEVVGFSRPCEFAEGLVFDASDGTRLINVEVRARVLPSNVIKKHLAERIEEYTRRMGRKPGRKDVRSLKEDLIATMLPSAFIRAAHIPVMISSGYLFIATTSPRVSEEIVLMLRSLIGYDALEFTTLNRDPEKWMTMLFTDDQADYYDFTLGGSAVLKRGTAVVRLKDVNLENPQVREYLNEGFTVRELALEWDESIKFKLTDKFALRGIKFNDVMLKDARTEEESATFDGTVAIICGTLIRLLDEFALVMPLYQAVPTDDEL